MVIANFNGVLMDQEFWKDPEVFRPDRFIDADGKLNVPDQYLPFGFGKYRTYLYNFSLLIIIIIDLFI